MTLCIRTLACACLIAAAVGTSAQAVGSPRPSQRPATGVDAARPSLPSRIIASCTSFLGVPYVTAGDSRRGMDCSGFVYRVFLDTTGEVLSRGVEGLFQESPTAGDPLHIGDLLFFDTGDRARPSVPTHVGIYIGEGRIVHAASEGSRTGVIISHLGDPYYQDRFLGARRPLPWRAPVLDVILTDDPTSVTEVEPFPSGETVTVRIHNHMSGGGPVNFALLKDSHPVLSRWITVGARPAELSFRSEVGRWAVRINRIFKGRTLTDVSFGVVE